MGKLRVCHSCCATGTKVVDVTVLLTEPAVCGRRELTTSYVMILGYKDPDSDVFLTISHFFYRSSHALDN